MVRPPASMKWSPEGARPSTAPRSAGRMSGVATSRMIGSPPVSRSNLGHEVVGEPFLRVLAAFDHLRADKLVVDLLPARLHGLEVGLRAAVGPGVHLSLNHALRDLVVLELFEVVLLPYGLDNGHVLLALVVQDVV